MPAAVILVAHDDPIQRKLIDMLLSPDEPRLVMCEDGRQALEYLRDQTPDLAVVDANLPLVSGLDICNKIKSIRRLAEVPVVVTVPPLREKGARELRELGGYVKADLVLPQPLGDKNLRDRVLSLLAAKPASRPRPAKKDPSIYDTQIIEDMLDTPELSRETEKTLLEARIRDLEAENEALRVELEELRYRLRMPEPAGVRGLFGFFRK